MNFSSISENRKINLKNDFLSKRCGGGCVPSEKKNINKNRIFNSSLLLK